MADKNSLEIDWEKIMADEEDGIYCDVCGVHYEEEDPCPFH